MCASWISVRLSRSSGNSTVVIWLPSADIFVRLTSPVSGSCRDSTTAVLPRRMVVAMVSGGRGGRRAATLSGWPRALRPSVLGPDLRRVHAALLTGLFADVLDTLVLPAQDVERLVVDGDLVAVAVLRGDRL